MRPLKQSGIDLFGHWIKQQTWSEILNAETVDEKAETLQDMLLKKCDKYLPVKTRKISTDDQPFCTQKMKYLKRMKNREFRKDRRSEKWKDIESRYRKEVSQAKKSYYKNMVQDLKHSNPSQWYSKLKRLCSFDPNKAQPTIVESIKHLSDKNKQRKLQISLLQLVKNLILCHVVTYQFHILTNQPSPSLLLHRLKSN